MYGMVESAKLEIIACHLGDQQLCINNTSTREIRRWAAASPLPQVSPHVLSVRSVIPFIDFAAKLSVFASVCVDRSAMAA
ncbi:chemotaxis protein CheW (plasmid) [Rhizobium sp. CB3171]|uniref:chemotaxis protein CheW n=1 Tax=Rhizobium sp. CB3171 TaxID=3039157 RepID=UPI0024B0ACCA|nr:chemotaxis protein CheW [Rhizobium sp. CB3171]WFU04621.1 chemotaxis protein CheW [Rhizobium sp. CB3171]